VGSSRFVLLRWEEGDTGVCEARRLRAKVGVECKQAMWWKHWQQVQK
jgi:hypothetical protein